MRQFTHLNSQWTVRRISGISSGGGTYFPDSHRELSVIMTSFPVTFTCISDSTQGSHNGSILHENLDDETDDNLKTSLDKAIAKSTQQSE